MQSKRPIGIFDSGVGGLSILKEIKKNLPSENLIFLADQKNVPYGLKTQKELEKITERITKFLLKYDIKMLVIACNTATCYALSHLRKKFNIPIIGVVPAIKPAAKKSRKSKIAVMSTPATANSAYLKNLIKEHAVGTQVLRLGCEGLEDSIEDLDYPRINASLPDYVSEIKGFGADVVVLGCTHYPLIKDNIKKSLGSGVSVIDSSEAVANRVEYILAENNMLSREKLSEVFYTTADASKFSEVASILLNCDIEAQKAVI